MSTTEDISANTISTTITNVSTATVFDINSLMSAYRESLNVPINDGSGSDPSGNVPFSIQDLINAQQVIINKENEDRGNAQNFANMPIDTIKPQLYNWASIGFPGAYGVATLSLIPPSICSDGVTRQLVEYYTWLIGMSIEQWLSSMNAKTSGMFFTYSHNGSMNINLHISKLAQPVLF